MFCPKCGKQIPNDAVFCTGCGRNLRPTAQRPQAAPAPVDNEGSARVLSIIAMILTFLAVPIVGTILSVVGLVKYSNTQYRGTFIFILVFSIIWTIIVFAAGGAAIFALIEAL